MSKFNSAQQDFDQRVHTLAYPEAIVLSKSATPKPYSESCHRETVRSFSMSCILNSANPVLALLSQRNLWVCNQLFLPSLMIFSSVRSSSLSSCSSNPAPESKVSKCPIQNKEVAELIRTLFVVIHSGPRMRNRERKL